jgi:peptide/nickel transport system substrate-binding protein
MLGLTAAVVACVLATLSGGGFAASVVSDAEFPLSLAIDPNHVDPVLTNTGQANNIEEFFAQTLTTYIFTGKLEPLLATSWESNADATVWTFTLRSGVTFTDGTPFNATAVKKTFERMLDPHIVVTQLGDVKYVAAVDAPDDLHVVFHLKQPVSYFPSVVSGEASAITSPQSWTAPGNAYEEAEHAVGTGPYKLVEYVKGDHVLVERNDQYWGPKPYFARQLFKVMPDAAGREAAVRAGQMGLVINVPAPDLDALRANPALKVSLPYGRTIYMTINNQSKAQPLLRNRFVRQAMNYAVDKVAITKNVLYGAGTPNEAGIWPGQFGYCKVGSYAYSPAKAKALLAQAGAEGMHVSMLSPTGRYVQDIQAAEAIAQYLRAVGIVVDGPKTADSAAYQAAVFAPPPTSDIQLFIWSYVPDFPDAGQVVSHILITDAIPPHNGTNLSGYSNPEVDGLNAKAARERTRAASAADYCKEQQIIFNDAPHIFLWDQALPVVYSSKIGNIFTAPNGTVNTIYARPQ